MSAVCEHIIRYVRESESARKLCLRLTTREHAAIDRRLNDKEAVLQTSEHPQKYLKEAKMTHLMVNKMENNVEQQKTGLGVVEICVYMVIQMRQPYGHDTGTFLET